MWFASLVCTLILFGLILVVQIVHYPAFHWVDGDHFPEFEQFHAQRISYIVAPLMLTELALAVSLYFLSDGDEFDNFALLNLSTVILIWLSTLFLSIPCHNGLTRQKDRRLIEKLINSNWIRTILWGLRSILLSYIIWTKGGGNV